MKKLFVFFFLLFLVSDLAIADNTFPRGGGSSSVSTDSDTGLLSINSKGERISGKSQTAYMDFNDGPDLSWLTFGGVLNLRDINLIFAKIDDDLQTMIDNASAYDTIRVPDAAYTLTASLSITKPIHLIFSTGSSISTSASITNLISITSDNVIIENPTMTATSTTTTTGINVNCTGGAVCTNIKIYNPKFTHTGGASTSRGISCQDASCDIFNPIITVGSSGASDDAVLIVNTSTQESATTINIYNPIVVASAANNGSTSNGIRALKSSATQNCTVNIYNPRVTVTESGTVTSGGITADGSTITVNVFGIGTVNSSDADLRIANSATLNVYGPINLVNNTLSGTPTFLGRSRSLATQAGDYYSSDGTQGATVTTCTGFKNGLCISGT